MRTIPQIDKDIGVNRAKLLALYGHKPRTAGGWQKAWDAFPEFRTRDNDLFRERGEAQQVRDEEAHKQSMVVARRANAKVRKESAAKFKAQRAMEAAAPDLLKAVRMFIAWEENTHNTAPAEQHQQAMEAAYAAVAKVEGV
jgi:hypothetical protein